LCCSQNCPRSDDRFELLDTMFAQLFPEPGAMPQRTHAITVSLLLSANCGCPIER
jgi:hypothetical protein